ncbi:TLR4 interactor with leucine rich repeats [Menidia menidia]
MEASRFLAGMCLLLWLRSGSFSSLPAEDDVCPERCDCQHARHLMCANRGLRAVPGASARVSDHALIFSLGGNFIGNISGPDFSGYGNLVRLNLQYNQIALVHPESFEKLSKLEELYLGHNLLTALPAGALQPLKKLTIFYGNNNAIKTIAPELFSNLGKLVKLRLDGNAIEAVQDSVFENLTSLHYLHLEHNQVRHVHRNAFRRLGNLRFLNLAHNKQSAVGNVLTFSHLGALTTLLLSDNEIQYVGGRVFRNLGKLRKLSLSNNRISRLDGEALRGLTSLGELLADGNRLTEIPAGLLDPLERVEELDFSRNRISRVDPAAFSGLGRLRVLRLKDNLLSSLSGDIFARNGALRDLDLHGNNWTCDCRLEELRRWMTAARSRGGLRSVSAQCRHPATLRGRNLDHVNGSQLRAPGDRSRPCESGAGPAESRGGGVLVRTEKGRGETNVGNERGKAEEGPEETGNRNRTEGGRGDGHRHGGRDGATERREGEKRRREGPGEVGGSEMVEHLSVLKGKRPKGESGAAGRRGKGTRRSKVVFKSGPSATPTPTVGVRTSSPAHLGGTFDLLRAEEEEEEEESLPVITDPCVFNRHFIANVSVGQVTSSTVTVHWSVRGHRPRPPVHYRVLFDRFGTPERFPRYVYTAAAARAVTLRELRPAATYVVCVEGAVGGAVCPVAPRDHCAGVVTLPAAPGGGGGVTASGLQLATVATLAGNAALLLAVGGAWLGRSLRRRLQRRTSAVHVRHMYSTRRPFRSPAAAAAAATASVSADFASYQSGRSARLPPLEEGDLIQFPCDRFLESAARRDADMQRFSD